jgi:hypothetical protein
VLMSRIFEPRADQLLYHYCSPESFEAILESGRLRFTDINMLNDSAEHRWGYSIFEQAATRLLKRTGVPSTAPEMKIDFFDAVDEILHRGSFIAHPFVSCLSLEENSLDQWIKYAADGRGYSIGFRADALTELPISLLSVSYDPEEQVREMMVALLAIHSRGAELPLAGDALEDVALLWMYMSAMKHPSFHSEREVRCVRAVAVERVGSNLKFADRGGKGRGGVDIPGETVRFTTRAGCLTAHVDIPYNLPGAVAPIEEVALGPKNETGVGNVFLFLGGLGHSHIKVRMPSLPYR